MAHLIQHFANGMYGRSIATIFRVALSKQAILMRQETTCFALIRTVLSNDVDDKKNCSKNKFSFYTFKKGLFVYGALVNLGTEAANFSQLFPGLTAHPMTLSLFFKFPIARFVLSGLGFSSSSRKCIEHVLNNRGAWHHKGQVNIKLEIYSYVPLKVIIL